MLFATAGNTVFSATTMPTPIKTTTVEWPEREEVPEPERARLLGALPFAAYLADGVVDRRDVVGVERVPEAEGVGQDRHADPEPLVMRGDDKREKTKNPSTCRPAITPNIAITRVRSWWVIATNDWRIIAATRGDPEVGKSNMVGTPGPEGSRSGK